MIRASQIAHQLDQLKPVDLQAARLVRHIEHGELASGSMSATGLLALVPNIEAALDEAERLAEHSRRIVKQCLELKPTSQPSVPLGF